MRFAKAAVAVFAIATATVASAQESGIRVRSIRVLAADVEAVATFYKKAFGMSETSRPVNSPTFKEIIINTGSTPEAARKATSTPIVIATRAKEGPPAGGLAAVILQVPDINKAIEAVKASGGSLMRPPSKFGNLDVAFVKDPDGNQVELIAGS
jgi:predicted enzyme related to lactoylglutathione lyase